MNKRDYVKSTIQDYIEDGIEYEITLFDEDNPNIFCVRFEGEYDRMDLSGFLGDIVVDIMNTQDYDIHDEDYAHNLVTLEILKSTINEMELED